MQHGVPGVPRPAKGGADEFLNVRGGGIPAGTRELYVIIKARKEIALNGLLYTMRGLSILLTINPIWEIAKILLSMIIVDILTVNTILMGNFYSLYSFTL